MMGSSTDGGRRAVESAVAAIWTEVLNVEGIHSEANFFDLGGHSLLAIRVMSRVQARLDVDLPLAALFQHPTLQSFSQAVGDAMGWVLPATQDHGGPTPLNDQSADLEHLLTALDELSDDEAAALLQKLESNPGFGS